MAAFFLRVVQGGVVGKGLIAVEIILFTIAYSIIK